MPRTYGDAVPDANFSIIENAQQLKYAHTPRNTRSESSESTHAFVHKIIRANATNNPPLLSQSHAQACALASIDAHQLDAVSYVAQPALPYERLGVVLAHYVNLALLDIARARRRHEAPYVA